MKTFESEKFQLTIAGIYPSPRNSLRPFYWFARIISLTLFPVQVLLMFKSFLSNISDLAKVSENLYYLVTQIAFVCKVVNIVLQSKKMLKIENYLIKKTSVSLYSKEELDLMDTTNFTRRLCVAYRLTTIISLSFYSFVPLFAKNSDGSRKLPSPVSLPFDPMKYYYQVLTVMNLCVAYGVFILISIDNMTYLLLGFGIGQIEILKYRIENVIRPGKIESYDVVQKKFKEYAKQLSEIYR